MGLVAIISIPVGIITALIVMYMQGINANIMSLGGIAIAIGAMSDGAIVMIEKMHKHMEKTPLTKENRWQDVIPSCLYENICNGCISGTCDYTGPSLNGVFC